jgi:hypothetical protein
MGCLVGFDPGTHVLSFVMLAESNSPNFIPRRDGKRHGRPLDEKPIPAVDGATSQFQCLKPSIDSANAVILLINGPSGFSQTVDDLLTPEIYKVSPCTCKECQTVQTSGHHDLVRPARTQWLDDF